MSKDAAPNDTVVRRHLKMTVFLAVLGAILFTLVVMNFMTGEKKIKEKISPLYGVDDPQFLRSMGSLLGPAIVGGNSIQELTNGDQIFPAMLSAIRGAQQSITFETYIYWSGTIGKEFTAALVERARAGVPVHVLLDWVGTGKIDEAYLDAMTKAGVQIERYHPLRWYNLGRMNNRTHRKLLVVDGRIGFTGGVGIADKWQGHAQSPDNWRDSHYRVEGPVVAQMQAAFMDNWLKTKAEVLHGDRYFPPLQPAGADYAQMFKSSPGEGSESVRLMYLLSIASAKKSIRIANAYFVPDDLTVETLLAARKRGVTIDVVLPGPHIDTTTTRNASRSRWGPLLDAGVRIYEYQPTMYHCKIMIVDDQWSPWARRISTVGRSASMTRRTSTSSILISHYDRSSSFAMTSPSHAKSRWTCGNTAHSENGSWNASPPYCARNSSAFTTLDT